MFHFHAFYIGSVRKYISFTLIIIAHAIRIDTAECSKINQLDTNEQQAAILFEFPTVCDTYIYVNLQKTI